MKTLHRIVLSLVFLTAVGSMADAAQFSVLVKGKKPAVPLEEAVVNVLVQAPNAPVLSGYTDASGRVSFGNQPPGNYYVEVVYRGETYSGGLRTIVASENIYEVQLLVDQNDPMSDIDWINGFLEGFQVPNPQTFPCQDGCMRKPDGTCPVPNASCAATTPVGQTCQDACQITYPGTLNCGPTCTPPAGIPAITSPISISATVGTPFTYQITATNSPNHYIWAAGSATQGLPGGLSVNPQTGLISGVPASPGTYTTTLYAGNAIGNGTAKLTLTIAAAPTGPTVNAVSVTPNSGTGMTQSFQFLYSDSAGVDDIWSAYATFGGATTCSLNFDFTSYRIAPAQVKVSLYKDAGGTISATAGSVATLSNSQCSVDVSKIKITPAPSTAGHAGTALLAVQVPITFTQAFAGSRPIFMYVNGFGGAASGWQQRGTWTVAPGPTPAAPVINSPLTFAGTRGRPFSYQITAANNPTHYNAASLPPGLTINQFTGLISGTPTQLGTSNVTLSAINSVGTGTASLALTIKPRLSIADFDGDGISEIAVWRPTSGMWQFFSSLANYASYKTYQWGAGAVGDIPMAGDYDGDGKTDIAVWRLSDGHWYILTSISNFTANLVRNWGTQGDLPVSGDFDGDGKTDMTVWRPSDGYWYILTSASNFTTNVVRNWGLSGDIPVSGDFDGDGKTDVTVWRPSTGVWWILTSASNLTQNKTYTWGIAGDIPVSGDFDGDGKTDIAVWRPSDGHWYILTSASNFTANLVRTLGTQGDMPVSADFDGDGKTDMTVWRPSTGEWFYLPSSSNYNLSKMWKWGITGDVPMIRMKAYEAPPPSTNIISLSPSSGTALSQVFTITAGDTLGASDINRVQFVMTTSTNVAGSKDGCLIRYQPAANTLDMNNSTDGSSFQPAKTLGIAGTLTNDSCTLDVGASSVTTSGSNLTLKLALTFKPINTARAYNLFANSSGASAAGAGFQQLGTWTVPALTPPAGLKATCNSPLPGQVTLSWNPVAGADGYMARVDDTVNGWESTCTSPNAGDACTGVLTAASYSSKFLSGHAYNWWVHPTQGSAIGAPTSSTFTCTIPPITALSVTPSSGTGNTQIFTFQWMDTAGANDLFIWWFVFAPSFNPASVGTPPTTMPANICAVSNGGGNTDLNADSGVQTAATPWGAATPVQKNSQCTIDVQHTTVVRSGSILTQTVPITFAPGFKGPKQIYMHARNQAGVNSGWQNMGTWTVPTDPVDLQRQADKNTMIAALQTYYKDRGTFPASNGWNCLTSNAAESCWKGSYKGYAPLIDSLSRYIGSYPTTYDPNTTDYAYNRLLYISNIGANTIAAGNRGGAYLVWEQSTPISAAECGPDYPVQHFDSMYYCYQWVQPPGDLNAMRLADKNAMVAALQGYYKDRGTFPASNGWNCLTSNAAESCWKGNYTGYAPLIDSLSRYVASYPTTYDTNTSEYAYNRLLYISNVGANGFAPGSRAGAYLIWEQSTPISAASCGPDYPVQHFDSMYYCYQWVPTSGLTPQGITVTTQPDAISSLQGIRVYPNPWRGDQHADISVTFDNLPDDSRIKIFTVSGHLVATLSAPASARSLWNLKNDSGDKVASGTYVYLIQAQGQKKTGQIFVVK